MLVIGVGPGHPGSVHTSSASDLTRAGPGPSRGPTEGQRNLLARIDSLGSLDEHVLALDLVRRELPPTRARADSLFLLPLLLREGHIETFFGNAVQAEASLREAREIAIALADSATLTSSTRWIAVALGAQGRIEEAKEECEALLQLARQQHDLRHEAWAHVGLAWNSEVRGDWHEAERAYESAVRAFAEAGDEFGESWARNGLGTIQSVLGEFDRSRETLEAAAEQAEEIGYTLVEAFARTNLGQLEWSFGDPSEAETQFRQLAALHRRTGSAREAVVPELEIARCEWTLGKMRHASARIESLLTACREKSWLDYEGKALRHLADLRGLQSRPDDAIDLYQEALALGPSIAADDRIGCILGWSDALAARGDPGAGLAILDRHEDELREVTHGAFALELAERRGRRLLELGRYADAVRVLRPAAREADSLGLSRLRVPLDAELAQAHRELGQIDSALVWLRSARDAWQEERSVPKDPEWREERGATGRLVSTDLADILLDHPASHSYTARVKDAHAAVRGFKARTLLERRLGPAQAVQKEASNETLELGTGELLLDYYLGPRVSLLFVASPESVRAFRLPAETELEGKARVLGEILATPPSPGMRGQSDSAVRIALGAFEDLFPDAARAEISRAQRVLYSADGALHLVPFPLLWNSTRAGTELLGADAESTHEWCSIPSPDLLAELRAQHSESPLTEPPPTPGASDDENLSILALSASRDASLPGASREVDWLARHFRNVERRLNEDESEDAGRLASWQTYDLIHIASHAHTYDEAPWRSEIDCGPKSGVPVIRADEIARAQLDARLAVLSSCRSVGARSLTGEGVQGLSSAFLAARVPVVVATLWPVDDASAEVLMRHFYSALERGETVAAALDQARVAVSSKGGTESPFFWAGYVAIGDGAIRVPLQARPHPARWARVSGAVATDHLPLLVGLACWVLLVVTILHRRAKSA